MTWISQKNATRPYRLFVAIFALVLMAAATVTYLALPSLVPENKLREALAAHTATWSGGEFRLPANVEVSLDRGPAMTAENAVFKGTLNGDEWQLDVASLHATFKVLPLLQGKVEIDTLTLDTPHLRLQAHDDTVTPRLRESRANEPGHQSPGGEVIITNASFTYEGPTGRRVGVDGIDLRMTARPGTTEVLLTGVIPAGKERLQVEGWFEDPAVAFSGSGSKARLALRTADIADDDGTPPQPEVPVAAKEGEMVSALRRIAAAVGLTRIGPIVLEGNFSATPRTLEITDAAISFSGFLAEGDLAIALGSEETPFDQVGSVVRGALAAWRDASIVLETGAWREAPVTLDWLVPLDIMLSARFRNVRFAGKDLEARHFLFNVSSGHARLEVAAAGDLGRLWGELALSAQPGEGAPQVALNGRLENVELGETSRALLSLMPPSLVSPPQLPEGTLDAAIDVTTQGETLGAMVTAFNGMLSAKARDGSIAGANLPLTLEGLANGRKIMTEKDGPLIPAGGRTKFDTAEARIDFVPGSARLSKSHIRGERYDIDLHGEANLKIGAMRGEGQAKLHGNVADDDVSFPLVDLPFGLGGSLAAPVVAAGVPRSGDALTSEPVVDNDIE